MHYLITGGAGFIGSFLGAELLRRGHQVTSIDDLSTGSRANISELEETPGFKFIVGSGADRELMPALAAGCDFIFHLAAVVGVKRVVQSPLAAIHSNYGLAAGVLEIAATAKKPIFIASSSEVYGKSDRIPYSENDDLTLGRPDIGRWSYASAKALLEFLAVAMHRELGLPVIIGRLFNTVGARQNTQYGAVLPTFVNQALSHNPITIHGDGLQTRCFIHVADTVDALIKLSAAPACYGGIFNIGSSEEITIVALAHRVREHCGGGSPIVHVDRERVFGEHFEDCRRRVPDTGKLTKAIDWCPRRTIDDAIGDVAVFFSRERAGAEAPR
jgi:UDP-glucose 4-epimerase